MHFSHGKQFNVFQSIPSTPNQSISPADASAFSMAMVRLKVCHLTPQSQPTHRPFTPKNATVLIEIAKQGQIPHFACRKC
jgi:hypothetical protein